MSDQSSNYCVTECTECPKLVESRSQIVNGVGPNDAQIMLVGEAPGESEDQTGEPFKGRSGTVLDKSITNHGLSRSDLRITNIVRCRPPENRDPHKSERENCSKHLTEEIKSVKPSVILTLGRIPTQTLLQDSSISVTEKAGTTQLLSFDDFTTTVLIGIHPAATLYNPSQKTTFENVIQSAVEISNKSEKS